MSYRHMGVGGVYCFGECENKMLRRQLCDRIHSEPKKDDGELYFYSTGADGKTEKVFTRNGIVIRRVKVTLKNGMEIKES